MTPAAPTSAVQLPPGWAQAPKLDVPGSAPERPSGAAVAPEASPDVDWQAQSDTLPALDWASALPDPVLAELIPLALKHNRDWRIALANLAQVRAQADLRAAERWPSLNASANGSRTPTAAGGIASSYTAGVGVTAFEIDLFGRLKASSAQAQAAALASLQGAQAARLSLIAGVAQAWAGLLADTDAAALTEQALQTRTDSLGLVQRRADVGAASALDVQTALSAVESARAAWLAQQRSVGADRRALEQLIGQPLPKVALAALHEQPTPRSTSSAAPKPDTASGAPDQPPTHARDRLSRLRVIELPAGLPAEVLRHRPDVLQAEANLAAAHANVQAVRVAYWPRITLTAAVGTASTALANLASAGTWGWTLAPSMTLPLLDAGRADANNAAAQAARALALAQYERTVQTAFREVADLLQAQDSLVTQAQAQSTLLAAETQRHRLVTLRRDQGAASQLEWLDAQRSLLAAQQAELATRLALVANRIALFKALGGMTRG